MGNQTTIIIRNDGLGEIVRHPQEFVKNLWQAINSLGCSTGYAGIDISAGNHANPARVVECHHADGTAIIAAGGSTARVVGHLYNWRWKDDEELKRAIVTELNTRHAKDRLAAEAIEEVNRETVSNREPMRSQLERDHPPKFKDGQTVFVAGRETAIVMHEWFNGGWYYRLKTQLAGELNLVAEVTLEGQLREKAFVSEMQGILKQQRRTTLQGYREALEQVRELIEGYVDVKDGPTSEDNPSGGGYPNDAMRAVQIIDEALK